MDLSQLPPGIRPDQIPAGRPPSGLLPNFDDPVSLKDPLVAVNVTLLVITTLFVGLRVYIRIFINHKLGLEDYACVLALLGSAAHSGLIFYLVNHGLGVHLWDVRAITLTPRLAHVFNALGLTYGLVIFLVKASVLILFYSLFGINQIMRYLIYFGLFIAGIFCIGLTGFNIAAEVNCVDAANLTKRVCIDGWKVTVANGSVNTLVDLYILILPMAKVSQLQLSARRKLGVIAIFMIGLLAVIASLVRLILSAQRGTSQDEFWDAALTSICSCIEMNVGIMCASVPVMPTFFRQIRPGLASLNSFRYRVFHRSTGKGSTTQVASKGKSFHGISLNMTTPSLGMGTKLGGKGCDELELEEGGEGRLLKGQVV